MSLTQKLFVWSDPPGTDNLLGTETILSYKDKILHFGDIDITSTLIGVVSAETQDPPSGFMTLITKNGYYHVECWKDSRKRRVVPGEMLVYLQEAADRNCPLPDGDMKYFVSSLVLAWKHFMTERYSTGIVYDVNPALVS